MQAWPMLQDPNTSEYMIGSIKNAPSYSAILKEVNKYPNEDTEEDTPMDIVEVNFGSEQCIIILFELCMSSWDAKVLTECFVKPQSVD